MIAIYTDAPIALDSPDHLYPVGTARDNSVCPEFNARLYERIPADRVRLLDLGCAGGGLVRSILDDGGFAVGVEGSDYSRTRKRAEWTTIPEHLFTADITAPFEIRDERGHRVVVNVCTAWEALEHIAEHKLAAVADNIRHHLRPGGLLLGSIADFPWEEGGYQHHQTVRPRDWWMARLMGLGFAAAPDLEAHFAGTWVRTEGFPLAMRML